MNPQSRGWAAFGAFALDGYLPREKPLKDLEARIAQLCGNGTVLDAAGAQRIEALRAEWARQARRLYASLAPWETVVVARHAARPLVTDYIRLALDDFCELHGDGISGDDPAMVTGYGRLGEHRLMLVGHNRGRTVAERTACYFGCPRPEGYRKALAKMRLAAKFSVPIVTLIDTPGAYPGVESEQRGIARAIAANLAAMPRFRVPVVSVVIGEGGSGGALAIGVADRVAMFEHAVYSVISPEGCAAILWKSAAHAPQAASALCLRAHELERLGLIDDILPEPPGGAHRSPADAAANLRTWLSDVLTALRRTDVDQLVVQRYERLRRLGCFFDPLPDAETDRLARACHDTPRRGPVS